MYGNSLVILYNNTKQRNILDDYRNSHGIDMVQTWYSHGLYRQTWLYIQIVMVYGYEEGNFEIPCQRSKDDMLATWANM